jgi:hypothetical protein
MFLFLRRISVSFDISSRLGGVLRADISDDISGNRSIRYLSAPGTARFPQHSRPSQHPTVLTHSSLPKDGTRRVSGLLLLENSLMHRHPRRPSFSTPSTSKCPLPSLSKSGVELFRSILLCQETRNCCSIFLSLLLEALICQ